MSLLPFLLISLFLPCLNLSPCASSMANLPQVASSQNASNFLLSSLIHLRRPCPCSSPHFIHPLRSSWASHGSERPILLSIGLPWPLPFAVAAVAPCLPFFLLMLLNPPSGSSTLLRVLRLR